MALKITAFALFTGKLLDEFLWKTKKGLQTHVASWQGLK